MSIAYDKQFYEAQWVGSQASARVVVPLVLSLVKIESVIDVGCGIGTWLSVFAEEGVSDYIGVDGDYVDREMLLIPGTRFKEMDLRDPVPFGRKFDLACSLEVAEHLPRSSAENFVAALVSAAPIVLFSAAIPKQDGTDHINEQWQSYWANLFARHGYRALDVIRPKIAGHAMVEWWYQQNILIFCEPGSSLSELEPVENLLALDHVHPHLFSTVLAGPRTGKDAVRGIFRGISVATQRAGAKLLRAARLSPPQKTHRGLARRSRVMSR